MSGDWIKMRVGLSRDPKVIAIAKRLHADEVFHRFATADSGDSPIEPCHKPCNGRVTLRVTVSVCIDALLILWGMAREEGGPDKDDLVVKHCSLDSLNILCGVPRFAEAMHSVGWAVERDGAMVFPGILAETLTPAEKKKKKDADRQRDHRDKLKAEREAAKGGGGAVTQKSRGRNVTITDREEKSRGELNTVPGKNVGSVDNSKSSPGRGRRSWWLSEAGAKAEGERLGVRAAPGESLKAYVDRVWVEINSRKAAKSKTKGAPT